MTLTEQQEAFKDAYLETHNATEAARLAGYSHPNKQGYRLLNHPEIKAAIVEEEKDRAVAHGVDQEWLLGKLVDMYYVATATVKPKLNSKTGKAIKDDEGNPVYTINHGAALKALELIGKYLGVFKDSVEIQSTSGDYSQRLEDVKADVLSRYGSKLHAA